MRHRLTLALAFMAVAGAARAETVQVRFEAEPPAAAIRMPKALTGATSGDLFIPGAADSGQPALPRGVAKTAVDYRLSASGGVVGSLGYLCGIQKSSDAPSDLKSSYEPAGTFLGGQLKVAF